MMRKLFLILTLVSALNCFAITPTEAFATAPDSIFPLIPKMKRLDMIDYFNAGSSKKIPNRLNGISFLSGELHDVLHICESDNGAFSDISVTKGKTARDSVIILVRSYKTPVTDGSIAVFDSGWNSLPGFRFTEPVLKDWVSPDAEMSLEDLENLIPFVPATYAFYPESGILIVRNTLEDLLGEETFKKVEPSIKLAIRYKWNGSKMILQK